jgi:hypothetical protein
MDEAGTTCVQSQEAEGKYTNYLKVGHNAFEFLLDFGQFFVEQQSRVQFHTRLVTTPGYMREFLKIMNQSVEQYESAFGVIAPAPDTKDGHDETET